MEQSDVLLTRIKEARKAQGLTQQEVAEQLGLARTTLVAIEKGDRPISSSELVALARVLNRPVSELVRSNPIAQDFVAHFRLRPDARSEDETLAESVRLLQDLADDYVTLERLVGARLPQRYPAETTVSTAPGEAGESLALAERNRLGLGDAPVHNLRQLLESDVGLRIFVLDLPGSVAGLFVHSSEYGACVALNKNHPAERQRWSLAHEYAHFLAHRSRTEVTLVGRYQRVPLEERFADAFAEGFLMPSSGIRRRFHEIRQARGGAVTPADLLHLADLFQVSLEALVLRLENLDLVRAHTWDRLVKGGFRVGEARQMLQLMALPPDTAMLPLRFRYLAVEAYLDGEISEGQFARFLRVDRSAARRLAHQLASRVEVEESGELSAVEIDTLGPIEAAN
jgi:Zn-dependent peptidase ImmA (M78 family)/transcriptional regulator with XRE-family HTH domain